MSTPRKIRCEVGRVIGHGDHVYTVDLKPERPVPAFHPGQFLHLALDDYDPSGFWPESRVFSIASSPAARDRLRIIYSVKGIYTARMEKELCEGKRVWVKLPYGEFLVDGHSDAVLIAGGTGITAFQAFIEGLPPDHPNKVILLYGAKRSELLLSRGKIEEKRAMVSQLHAFYFSETGPQGKGEEILSGRVTLDVLKDFPLNESAVYYLAGPPAMITAFRAGLGMRGVPETRIRIDAWE